MDLQDCASSALALLNACGDTSHLVLRITQGLFPTLTWLCPTLSTSLQIASQATLLIPRGQSSSFHSSARGVIPGTGDISGASIGARYRHT